MGATARSGTSRRAAIAPQHRRQKLVSDVRGCVTRVCVCVYVCIVCGCMYVCVCVRLCLYVSVRVCMHVHMPWNGDIFADIPSTRVLRTCICVDELAGMHCQVRGDMRMRWGTGWVLDVCLKGLVGASRSSFLVASPRVSPCKSEQNHPWTIIPKYTVYSM